MTNAELINRCTGYLRQTEWGFMTDGTQQAIDHSFLAGFKSSPLDQRTSITHKLIGLSADIRLITADHPLRSILHDRAIVGILNVLEAAAVIESARPGGLQKFRQQLTDKPYADSGLSITALALNYLDEQERGFAKVKSGSVETDKQETAAELLNISSGIRFELTRLGLVDDIRNNTDSKVHLYGSKPLVIVQSLIERDTLMDGLIGFRTLNEIIQKFWDTKKYVRIAGAWD